MYRLAWFFVLFAAGLLLLLTAPQGAVGPAAAREVGSPAGDLGCPFELSTESPTRTGQGAGH